MKSLSASRCQSATNSDLYIGQVVAASLIVCTNRPRRILDWCERKRLLTIIQVRRIFKSSSYLLWAATKASEGLWW